MPKLIFDSKNIDDVMLNHIINWLIPPQYFMENYAVWR